jgi:hypothetical protein
MLGLRVIAPHGVVQAALQALTMFSISRAQMTVTDEIKVRLATFFTCLSLIEYRLVAYIARYSLGRRQPVLIETSMALLLAYP